MRPGAPLRSTSSSIGLEGAPLELVERGGLVALLLRLTLFAGGGERLGQVDERVGLPHALRKPPGRALTPKV